MKRKRVRKIFSLFFVLTGISFCLNSPAEETEKINLHTYYPSPKGIYQELQSSQLKIGEINSQLEDGQIKVEKSLVYGVHQGLPLSPNREEGETIYYGGNKKLKYFDGSTWKPLGEDTTQQASSSGCFTIYYSNSMINSLLTDPGGDLLDPCPRQGDDFDSFEQVAKKQWGICYDSDTYTQIHFSPHPASCASGLDYEALGWAFRCCSDEYAGCYKTVFCEPVAEGGCFLVCPINNVVLDDGDETKEYEFSLLHPVEARHVGACILRTTGSLQNPMAAFYAPPGSISCGEDAEEIIPTNYQLSWRTYGVHFGICCHQ